MSQPNDPFRFRLASMLLGTAMVAFVVYATVQPSVWAASLGFTAAIGALSLALVRGLVLNGVRRRYLLAFSLAGAAYLSVLYLPVIDERIGARLLPAIGFAHLEGMLLESDASSRDERMRRIMIQRDLAQGFVHGEIPTKFSETPNRGMENRSPRNLGRPCLPLHVRHRLRPHRRLGGVAA